ncbi:hypothetical protein N7512_007046 [Penicillium capsulatum]|nr:hypothetical protein N7512_007046 [Penicillium capsulatum]
MAPSRRLAAVTGNPISICDEVIELDMPTDYLGFPTASALRTNLKISKVLSRIITVIYGPRRLAEDVFVPSVRDIVKSIFDIAQEIPFEATANYRRLSSDSSGRSQAYLHLMLYQAVILTTRPIMLHLAKQIVNGESIDAALLDSSPLARLSRSCSEAARRLLDVVIALREKDMLIIFGFFDFDACFSAAFVMILSAIVDSVSPDRCKKHLPRGLRDALDTLEFLSDRGNHLAKRGLIEVRQTWACFSAYLERRDNIQPDNADQQVAPMMGLSDEPSRRTDSDFPGGSDRGVGMPITQEDSQGSGPLVSENMELGEAMPLDTNLLDDFAQLWDGITDYQRLESVTDDSGCMPTDGLQHYLYPLYNSLDLDLVGGDIDSFAGLRQSMLSL